MAFWFVKLSFSNSEYSLRIKLIQTYHSEDALEEVLAEGNIELILDVFKEPILDQFSEGWFVCSFFRHPSLRKECKSSFILHFFPIFLLLGLIISDTSTLFPNY
jgi:hypothetical protein